MAVVPVTGAELPAADGQPAQLAATEPVRLDPELPAGSKRDGVWQWLRATVTLAAGGSVLALGGRALFERLFGAAPYAMPSTGAALWLIVLASAIAAALAAWTSTITAPPKPGELPDRLRLSTGLSTVALALLVGSLIQSARSDSQDIAAISSPQEPVAVLERRAALRPGHMQSQLALVAGYYNAGRYGDAVHVLQYVEELTRGRLIVKRYSYADRSWTQREWEPTPPFTRASVLYALAYAHTLSPEASLDFYREAYELGGHASDVAHPLFDALMAAKRYDEARTFALNYLTDHAYAQEWRGLYAMATNEALRAPVIPGSSAPGPAAVIRDKMLSLEDPTRKEPLDAFGEAKLSFEQFRIVLGATSPQPPENFDLPIRHADAAARLAPANADYRAQLGLELAVGKHWKSADSAFAKAVALDSRVLRRNEGFAAMWELAKKRARGEPGGEFAPFTLHPPRRP